MTHYNPLYLFTKCETLMTSYALIDLNPLFEIIPDMVAYLEKVPNKSQIKHIENVHPFPQDIFYYNDISKLYAHIPMKVSILSESSISRLNVRFCDFLEGGFTIVRTKINRFKQCAQFKISDAKLRVFIHDSVPLSVYWVSNQESWEFRTPKFGYNFLLAQRTPVVLEWRPPCLYPEDLVALSDNFDFDEENHSGLKVKKS